MKRSHRRRTAGPRPWPSLPTTRASGPRRSVCRTVSGASASAPATRRPRTCRSASPPGRSSTGHSSRCSVAPAEAFTADGVSGAWRWVGKSTPWTPAASALRRSVPTFCGSSSESRTSTNGGSPRSTARARMSSMVAHRRGATTSPMPWWPSKPARAVSDPPSSSTIGMRRLVAWRTRRSSAWRRCGTTSSRRASRRAANASSTGRRPAISSSSAPMRSGGGSAGAGWNGRGAGPRPGYGGRASRPYGAGRPGPRGRSYPPGRPRSGGRPRSYGRSRSGGRGRSSGRNGRSSARNGRSWGGRSPPWSGGRCPR